MQCPTDNGKQASAAWPTCGISPGPGSEQRQRPASLRRWNWPRRYRHWRTRPLLLHVWLVWILYKGTVLFVSCEISITSPIFSSLFFLSLFPSSLFSSSLFSYSLFSPSLFSTLFSSSLFSSSSKVPWRGRPTADDQWRSLVQRTHGYQTFPLLCLDNARIALRARFAARDFPFLKLCLLDSFKFMHVTDGGFPPPPPPGLYRIQWISVYPKFYLYHRRHLLSIKY